MLIYSLPNHSIFNNQKICKRFRRILCVKGAIVRVKVPKYCPLHKKSKFSMCKENRHWLWTGCLQPIQRAWNAEKHGHSLMIPINNRHLFRGLGAAYSKRLFAASGRASCSNSNAPAGLDLIRKFCILRIGTDCAWRRFRCNGRMIPQPN